MLVGKLNNTQKDYLLGREFSDSCYYNPIQDNNGVWIISIEEIESTSELEIQWIKNLEMIEFEPNINSVEPVSPITRT